MFLNSSTLSLFLSSSIFFSAANAVPLRERIVVPATRGTASDAELNNSFIGPSTRTIPGNDIPSDTVSSKTTTFKAPSPIRTLGVFSRADPYDPVFLSVIEETSDFADISTTLFVVSSTDAIQPTPTDTNTNDPKGIEVITNYQAEPTATGVTFDTASVDTQVASFSEPMQPSSTLTNSGNDIQPTTTETFASDPKGSEDITIVQAEPTTTDVTFDNASVVTPVPSLEHSSTFTDSGNTIQFIPTENSTIDPKGSEVNTNSQAEPTATDVTFDSTSVVTQVASLSALLEPTSIFSGNRPSTTFAVENGAVIGAVITNAPTGIASAEDVSQTEDSDMISEDQLPVGQEATHNGAVTLHTTGVDKERSKKAKKDKKH